MAQEDCRFSDAIDIELVCFAGVEGCAPPADGPRRGREGRRVGQCTKSDVVVDSRGNRPDRALGRTRDVEFSPVVQEFVDQVLGAPEFPKTSVFAIGVSLL